MLFWYGKSPKVYCYLEESTHKSACVPGICDLCRPGVPRARAWGRGSGWMSVSCTCVWPQACARLLGNGVGFAFYIILWLLKYFSHVCFVTF